MDTIRIYKKEKDSPNAFGCSNKEWSPSEYVVTFAGAPFYDVKSGEAINVKTGEPVSALDIVEELIKQNFQTVDVRSTGRTIKKQFANKWEIDYVPSLKPLFDKYQLSIPSDGKTRGDRLRDNMVRSLEMQGLITTGLATTDSAAGIKAIYESKLKAEEEALAKAREEKATLEAELAALKAAKATLETKEEKKKQKVEA